MSATLIAVVLALFLGHVVTALASVRRYGWFDRWLSLAEGVFGAAFASRFSIVLSLGLPLLLVGVVQAQLADRFYGVPAFLFAVATLIYCWGPRDLDRDVEAIEDAHDDTARQQASARLCQEHAVPQDENGWVSVVFAAARRRWFGVLLWFLLLGPFGALMYRLTVRGSEAHAADSLPVAHRASYHHLRAILDWPVAHLMSLALAIAGSFDAVYGAWRDWHTRRHDQTFDFAVGFLDAAALASVRQFRRDLSAEQEQDRRDGFEPEAPVDAPAALAGLHASMALVWRMLVVWILAIALFVLAGYV
ncbi:MAG TPA: hypothetical protein VFN29_02655 [Chiayiivirga sp.]|nr:hypothetical protein [Chiayiivirga sp.]